MRKSFFFLVRWLIFSALALGQWSESARAEVPKPASVSIGSKNAFAIQKILDGCKLERDDSKSLIKKIDGAADVTELACDAKTDATGNGKKSLAILAEAARNANRAMLLPPDELIHQFSRDLWMQSLRNLLLTRLDSELRYAIPGKKFVAPSAEKDFTDLCGAVSSKVYSHFDCTQVASLTAAEKAAMIKVGSDYVAQFKSSDRLSYAQATQALNQRINVIGAWADQTKSIQAEVPTATSRSTAKLSATMPVMARDQTSVVQAAAQSKTTFGYEKNQEWGKRLQESQQNYLETQTELSSSGVGLLLYSKSLQEYQAGKPLPAVVPGEEALSAVAFGIHELKTGIKISAGEMNTNLADALGPSVTAQARQNKNKNDPDEMKITNDPIAALEKMMMTNPVAVGQVLATHPEYASSMCFLLQNIETSKELRKYLDTALQTTMMATMIVGAAVATPELAGIEMAEWVQGAAAFNVFNSAVAQGAFYGMTAGHLERKVYLPSELSETRRSILEGRGATGSDLANKITEEKDNSVAIATDIFYAVTPLALGRLGKLKSAEEALGKGPILDDSQVLLKKLLVNKQWSAGFKIFSALCGMLDARCAPLMMAFEHIPGGPVERIAAQEKILSSRRNIEEFVKKTLNDESPVLRRQPRAPAGYVKFDYDAYLDLTFKVKGEVEKLSQTFPNYSREQKSFLDNWNDYNQEMDQHPGDEVNKILTAVNCLSPAEQKKLFLNRNELRAFLADHDVVLPEAPVFVVAPPREKIAYDANDIATEEVSVEYAGKSYAAKKVIPTQENAIGRYAAQLQKDGVTVVFSDQTVQAAESAAFFKNSIQITSAAGKKYEKVIVLSEKEVSSIEMGHESFHAKNAAHLDNGGESNLYHSDIQTIKNAVLISATYPYGKYMSIEELHTYGKDLVQLATVNHHGQTTQLIDAEMKKMPNTLSTAEKLDLIHITERSVRSSSAEDLSPITKSIRDNVSHLKENLSEYEKGGFSSDAAAIRLDDLLTGKLVVWADKIKFTLRRALPETLKNQLLSYETEIIRINASPVLSEAQKERVHQIRTEELNAATPLLHAEMEKVIQKCNDVQSHADAADRIAAQAKKQGYFTAAEYYQWKGEFAKVGMAVSTFESEGRPAQPVDKPGLLFPRVSP